MKLLIQLKLLMVTLLQTTEKMKLVIQVELKMVKTGNDEGTSMCGMYTMGNIGVAACKWRQFSQNDSSNLSNDAETRTYSADYQLGGGVTLGVVYFDVEQTANSVDKNRCNWNSYKAFYRFLSLSF